MIYLGKAACFPCKACGKACEEWSNACAGCSKGINDCCKSIGDFFAPVTRRPLGTYVIGTLVCMIAVGSLSGVTLSNIDCDGPKIPCYVNIAFSAVHSAFAFYIQARLATAMGIDGDVTAFTYRQVAKKAREVMAYDVSFCLYFFFFFGSFGYSCYNFTEYGDCDGTGPAWSATALLVAYGVGVFNYILCWYGFQCCCGGVEKVTGRREAPPAGQGVIMGAPTNP